MNNYNQDHKALAAFALFRELYDNQKNVYDVLAEFIKGVIIEDGKLFVEFDSTSITNSLNKSYKFSIPESVVTTSIKKNLKSIIERVENKKNTYRVKDPNSLEANKKFQNEYDTHFEANNRLIEGLFNFVKDKGSVDLNEENKEKILHSFYVFISNQSDNIRNEYVKYVAAYVMDNEEGYKKQLQTIKEGFILYDGITYNNNLSEKGSWNTKLTIFINTEELFHLAGYNGEIYKKLFSDFWNFVNKFNNNNNNRAGKNLITLKFFKDTKEEIERFFKAAETIIRQSSQKRDNTAMQEIIRGCERPSDIIRKKTDFYKLLKKYNITEDNYDGYYDEHHHKDNIEDTVIIDKISKDLAIEDKKVEEAVKLLGMIKKQRKQRQDANFDNIGHIFLTENSNTLKIAWHEEIKQKGTVPLATSLDYLTNKFWFRSGGSFSEKDNPIPISFDISTNSKIILAALYNSSKPTLIENYEKSSRQYKENELTREVIDSNIAEFKRPEDIQEKSDIDAVLKSISVNSIDIHDEADTRELTHTKHELEKERESKKELENTLKREREEKENTKKELEKYKDKEDKENAKKEKKRKRIKTYIKIGWVMLSFLFIAIGITIYPSVIFSLVSGISALLGILSFFGFSWNTICSKYIKYIKLKCWFSILRYKKK